MTRIMIAEDNTSVFSCYQKFLSKDESVKIIGYAKDGKTAVTMYKEKNPDILLLDLRLPKKNGLQIIEDLSEYESTKYKCNVIIISGDTRLRKKLLETKKVYAIIPKPINFNVLSRTINDFKQEQILSEFPEQKCISLLLELKIKPFSKSGKLLTDIIKLSYCDIEILENMNDVYLVMSRKKSCKPERIRSSLRSIIRTVNRFATYQTLQSIFLIKSYDINNVLSPYQFVNGLVSYLKSEY